MGRDDVSALLEVDRLQLLDEIGPLAGVECGESLFVELDVVRVAPMRLVVGRRGQHRESDLREVRPDRPEVLGKGPLEILVAEENVGGDLLDLHRDAGILGRTGEDLCRQRDAIGDVGRDQFHFEILVAGLFEEGLCLLHIPLALERLGRIVEA